MGYKKRARDGKERKRKGRKETQRKGGKVKKEERKDAE